MKEFGGRLGQEVYSTIVRYFAPVVAVYGKVETLLREPMGWQHKKFDEDRDVIGVSLRAVTTNLGDAIPRGDVTVVGGILRELSAHVDDATATARGATATGKAMTQ